MPASKIPGPTGAHPSGGHILDGTSALFAMPGQGAVGSSTHAGASPSAQVRIAKAQLQAALIDAQGALIASQVKQAIAHTIERGEMTTVCGIIVHQTDSATAQSTLDSYKKKSANGAHFLIDKDGTIYQTASLHQRTWHVGKLRARCLVEKTCTPTEIKAYSRWNPAGMHKSESAKAVPARYPSNDDAIGIELVGRALPEDPTKPDSNRVYETVTEAQNASLKWLVGELTQLLAVPMTEIFRHPDVSAKTSSEAAGAKWN